MNFKNMFNRKDVTSHVKARTPAVKDVNDEKLVDVKREAEDVNDNAENLYEKEEFDEIDDKIEEIRQKSEESRQRKPASISDPERPVSMTRERVVRDLDKILLPRNTTQVMDYLPTTRIVKLQMLRRRREQKIIDEMIRVNLREENEEFNEETSEDAEKYTEDYDIDSIYDDDFDEV